MYGELDWQHQEFKLEGNGQRKVNRIYNCNWCCFHRCVNYPFFFSFMPSSLERMPGWWTNIPGCLWMLLPCITVLVGLVMEINSRLLSLLVYLVQGFPLFPLSMNSVGHFFCCFYQQSLRSKINYSPIEHKNFRWFIVFFLWDQKGIQRVRLSRWDSTPKADVSHSTIPTKFQRPR